jgi:chaperonin cofactor prefoldin
MERIKEQYQSYGRLLVKEKKSKSTKPRRSRIERLKVMINNEDYLNEAIQKLANSLTSGLMK